MERSQSPSPSKGRLYIVGTGPGEVSQMTPRAMEAIRESEYIVGNKLYLDMLDKVLADKKVINSHMGKEVERAKNAVDLAKDHVVSIVSGGDAGVYGMASIVLEIIDHEEFQMPVEVIPGVTAATAAAARLGSPLSSDFAVISLSDLLTPWEVIQKRLDAAFSVQIPVVLYNPKSKTRKSNLNAALLIARKYLSPETPIGVVKDAFREGEQMKIASLQELIEDDSFVDMHSTVIIGGEESRIWKEGLNVKGIITPRGYNRKYVY